MSRMADEYILKSSVLNYLRHHSAFKSKSEIMQDIAEHEPADVTPVVHAHWIYHPNWELNGEYAYQCPRCQMGSDINHNYCMRCGAKMDGWVYEGEE